MNSWKRYINVFVSWICLLGLVFEVYFVVDLITCSGTL